jgi:solute carrier family 13 (sodium-dependent dicarboxylate transporter), member 2/3/5
LKNKIKILAGPLSGLICYFLLKGSTGDDQISKMGFVAVWMAVWWIFEAVSLYVTALLPLSLLPLLGIMDIKEVAPLYTNEIIFLFIGGFLIAFAIEKWNLHRRIAYKILMLTGSSPSRILLGVMFASYFLSMWISNIATTMMLLPAVLAIASQLTTKKENNFAVPLLLGLAYAASIGGTATLIGTAPNMIFAGFYNDFFPDQPSISFSRWFMFGIPVSIMMFACAYVILNFMFIKSKSISDFDTTICEKEYRKLGKMSSEEKTISILFLATVLLWFFRSDIEIENFRMSGWKNLFPYPDFITDSTVAMAMASLMFIIPSKTGGALISWKEGKKIPLGIIFLFGGGFALAKGISVSGLSEWLAINLSVVNIFHPVVMVILLCTFMTFFTELTSNTASTYLVLPIIYSISLTTNVNPLLLMVPVVFSASFAFMLPVATPPNTVVFASEQINIKTMIRAGFWINIGGVICLTLLIFLIGEYVFGI